ncbi:MAG: MFS transporter, partial [Actinobacteria bacterium]|nr:MFS transporter [Actinomycetota bacterium]
MSASAKDVRPAALIAAMALGGTAYGFAATMVIPAVPAIQRSLDVSPTAAGWALSAYLIAASVLTGIVGRLGDVFGRRRVLVGALVAAALGSAVCAATDLLPVLLVGRVIQGAGGGVYPLAYAILRERLEPGRRESALGLMAATMGLGGGFGPVLGGLVSDHASYRWIFVVVGVMALAAAALVVRVVPLVAPPAGGRARIDVLGAVVLAVTVSAPLIAVSQANRWGWAAPSTLALFAVGAAMLAVFVALERRVAEPLVSMRTMALPVVRWT